MRRSSATRTLGPVDADLCLSALRCTGCGQPLARAEAVIAIATTPNGADETAWHLHPGAIAASWPWLTGERAHPGKTPCRSPAPATRP